MSRCSLWKLAPRTAGLFFALLAACAAQKVEVPPPAPASGPQTFADPKAAVDALLAACRANDPAAVLAKVFGPDNVAGVLSDNQAEQQERCHRFVDAAGKMTRLDPDGENRLTLVVGTDDFPVPVPLVKSAQGWSWDAAAGAREMQRRRIGANELAAIALCRATVQKTSAPLPPPSRGYLFRPLTVKGKNKDAPVFLAYPSDYGHSGIMTFVVSRNGVVRQKDLGKDTATVAAALRPSQVDSSWQTTND